MYKNHLKKFICYGLILFLGICFVTGCQLAEKTDTYITNIDKQLSNYTLCKEDTLGLSSNDLYYDNNNLMMAKILYKSETGQLEYDVYFKDDQVVFINYLVKDYNKPYYEEGFKPDLKSVVIKQLYFKEGNLISLIDDGVIVDPETEQFASETKRWKARLEDLKVGDLIQKPVCQKDEIITVPLAPISEYHSEEIDQCLALQETSASEEWAYVDEKDTTKKGWQKLAEIDQSATTSQSFRRWENQNLRDVVIETTTPSGDWYRVDDYCFKKDGAIIGLYSDLHTFYGDVQVIRTWVYNPDGSIAKKGIEITHLDTKQLIDPDIAAFVDKPPYLTENYEDLTDYLELPNE